MNIKNYIATGILLTAVNVNFNDSADARPLMSALTSYEQKIRGAKEIVVSENVITWGKSYEILADGEKVADVSGRNAKWWTDRFVLKTLDGKVLSSEKENVRFGNRSAAFYGAAGNADGYISEKVIDDFFNTSHIFHVYNVQGNEVGVTKKKAFRVFDKIEVLDSQGNLDYVVNEKYNPFNDEYSIKVLDRNSSVPIEKVILLACIEDAIKDAND